jgi:phage minor structural protein
MEMIHILDGKTEHIIATLENKGDLVYWEDSHKERDDNGLNQYDFTTIDGTEIAAMLVPGNKIVIRDLDGNFIPFIIVRQEQKNDGSRTKRIMTDGEHIELRKAKIIEPTELTGFTLNDALDFVLGGTRWKRGITDYTETATVKFDKYINALEALQMIRSVFSVNLRFRAEIQGNRIVARYVDAIKPDDVFDGKEITFGKDILGVRRFEDHRELYTMLLGVGPADENGNYITIESVNNGDKYIRDEAAIQRWGELRGVFEYQPEQNEKVSPTLLKQKTQEALKNSINSYMTYEVDTIALENIPGFEHEKVRKGMTVRIKDEMFNPPLYLEARVLETERSYTSKNAKFVFGNYRTVNVVKDKTIARIQAKLFKNENAWSSSARVIRSATPPDDVHAIWIDITKNPEVPMTYDFTANEWKKASPTVADEIGAETPTGAQQKADAAKQEAKNYADVQDQSVYEDSTYYADQVAATAEQNAKQHADNAAATAENNAKQHADNVAQQAEENARNYTNAYAEKAIHKGNTPPGDTTQLWLDISGTTWILRRWNGTEWKAVAPMTADEIGAVDLSTYSQKIQEIENDIATKADADWVNGQLVAKADKADTYTKTEVDNALNSKVSVTTYTTDMNNVVTQLDDHETRITQTENEIATKVSNTTYQQDKTTLENDISSLETRMANAETQITQNASQIALKANKTDVYTKGEVDTALSNKADDSRVDTIETRVSNAEAQLTVQANQIATKVSQTDFTTQMATKANVSDVYTKNDIQILSANNLIHNSEWKTDTSGWTLSSGWTRDTSKTYLGSVTMKVDVSGLSSDAWRALYSEFVNVSAGQELVASGYTFSDNISTIDRGAGLEIEWYDANNTRISTVSVSVKPTANNTWQRFSITGVAPTGTVKARIRFHPNRNGRFWVARPMLQFGKIPTAFTPHVDELATNITSRLTTAESSITQLSDQILLKVNKSEYDIDVNNLKSRMSSAESQISILSDEIELRVEKNGVISAINQSAELIRIQAEKIEFDGAIFGENATFTGAIKTSGANGSVTIENDTIKQVLGDENANYNTFQRALLTSGSIMVEEIYKDPLTFRANAKITIQSGFMEGIDNLGSSVIVKPAFIEFGRSNGGYTANIDLDSDGHLHYNAPNGDIVLNPKPGNKVITNERMQAPYFYGTRFSNKDSVSNYQEWSGSTWKLMFSNIQALYADRNPSWARFKIGRVFLKGTDYSQSSGEILEVRTNDDAGWGTIKAIVSSQSRLDEKKNIEDFNQNVVDTVMNTPVKLYHYHNEDDISKKHLGLIVDYAPDEIKDITGDGIDHYAMMSYLWKAIQELYREIQILKGEVA